MPPRSKGPTSTSAPVVEKSETEAELARDESAEPPTEPASAIGALLPAIIMVAVLALLIVVGLLQR